MMTNILLIDTTTQYASVALATDTQVYTRFNDRPRAQAQMVLPMVEALCQSAGITPQEISVIVAAVGPGSFTGVRLSLSVAKTLAFALDCLIYPISTLDVHRAYLLNHAPHAQTAVAIDARMGQIYAQWNDEAPILCCPEDFWSACSVDVSRPVAIIGTGWDAYPVLMAQPVQTLLATHQRDLPSIESVLPWIKAQGLEEGLCHWQDCEPLYLRNTVVHTKK